MSRVKHLILQIHRRSLWQVLAIYVIAAWLAFQVIQTLTEGLGLPDWFPPFALVLFIIGLPIVLATAFVQEGIRGATRRDPTLLPDPESGGAQISVSHTTTKEKAARRLLTWRNAIAGSVVAFALWGVIAAGWVLFGPETAITASGGEDESGSHRPVLVVLPFENLGAPEDEYFADGLTEEITARLVVLPGLGVIGRTSAIRYKDTDKSISEIGTELSTDYVLEGTVRWQRPTEGLSRVRVTPQLVRVSDETHVWANIYEEEMADIFEVQSDIAGEVAEALDLALLDGGRSRDHTPTDNLEAYDLYLRAKDYAERTISRENNRTALALLERAIELDPTFALAYSQLSLEHGTSYWFFYDRSPARLARAKRAADGALELAPDLPEAHLALGDYHYRLLDYDRALEQFAIVQSANPSHSQTFARVAYVLRRKGQWKESIIEFEKALELDPVNTQLFFQTGISAFYLRDYEAAERYWDKALSLGPDEARPYVWTARSRVAQGDTVSAREVLEESARLAGLRSLDEQTWWHWAVFRVLESDGERALARLDELEMDNAFRHWAKAELFGMIGQPQLEQVHYDSARAIMGARVREFADEPRFLSELAVIYAGLGRNDDALREARKAVEIQPISKEALLGPDWVLHLAHVHMMLGDYDAAVGEIESLLAVPSPLSVHWLRLDPIWAPLRHHPRFQELVQGDR